MEREFRTILLALTGLCLLSVAASAAPPAGPPAASAAGQAEVSAIIKKSTEYYHKLNSYTADISIKTTRTAAGETESSEARFILALDRPNRFCYRDTSANNGTAAVCNGKQFTNFKADRKQYTQSVAPADFRGINIVDDVSFEPLGGYIIALMLQGNAYSDKDVRAALGKATMRPAVVESGKKYQVIHLPFGPQEEPYNLYVAEDGQISKTTLTASANQIKVTLTESMLNIKLDKPVDPAVFLYNPPATAHKVEKFTAPQRLFDAYQPALPHSGLSLASYAPPIPAMNKDVADIIDAARGAYSKMKSYQHTATFRASGTSQGKKVDQAAKFSMAMSRPNKFAFKMVSNTAVAVVSDGKQVTDFRAGEYSQSAAPAHLKDLKLDQDDFDPVAGSFLIAHLLEDTVYSDRSLLGILIKASGHKGLVAGTKTYDVIDFPIVGITFILYFDPSTHLLERAAAKVPDQDLTLTETFDTVEIDKPVPDSAFTFAVPKTAHKVAKPTR